jgi:hypothetical protein
MYNPDPKPEGCPFLQLHRSDLSDPMVRQLLNLQPLATDNDSGGSSDSNDIGAGKLLVDDDNNKIKEDVTKLMSLSSGLCRIRLMCIE